MSESSDEFSRQTVGYLSKFPTMALNLGKIERLGLMASTEELTMSEEARETRSPAVVTFSGSNSQTRESRTIRRLKLALEFVSLALLVMTILFVWQVTKENSSKIKDSYVDPSRSEEYLTFKSSPCPIMSENPEPPWLLPKDVERSLYQADVIFDSYKKLDGVVSMTGSVVYQDRVVWRDHHGVKDKEISESPDENTAFRVASVTKIFTVLFVFKLIEIGSIDCLDDPLETYVPSFQVINPFNQDKITIRHILSHTSGLPREVPCGKAYSYSGTHICPVNNTYILQQLKITELKSPPGRIPHYSNLGYALIARLLAEKFANGDFEGWVQRNIFNPLGMENTGFDLQRISANRALGYADDGVAPLVDWDWAGPAIQAYSTTSDLHKLMTLLLGTSGTAVLKSNLIQEMFKPEFIYPDGVTLASGWQIKNTGTFSLVGASGYIPGYSAGLVMVPEFKLGSIVLLTSGFGASKIASLIVETLAKVMDAGLVRKQLQFEITPNRERYIGEYVIVSRWIPEVIVNITEDNGLLLFTQIPGSLGFSYMRAISQNVFEVVYRPGLDCSLYALGQNHERVVFDPPSSDGLSPGLRFGPFVFKRKKLNVVSKQRSSNLKLSLSQLL